MNFKKMGEKVVENNGSKYSEMLYKIVLEFDSELPEELTFEETLDIGIEAWNLANNKDYLEKNNLYAKELNNHGYSDVIDKMVTFKVKNFSNFNNIIINYSTENDILQVKTQTFEDYFNSFLKRIVLTNPEQTSDK